MGEKGKTVHMRESTVEHNENTTTSANKLAKRRGTMMPPKKTKPPPPITYKKVYMWWEKPPITYAFNHPHVRSRLEKLMGSNLVSFTDRAYMQQLQEKILEDYGNCMAKRIAGREVRERERVKKLVLTGKIPLSQAPPEMDEHPIKLIELYCEQKIAERRAKIKVNKVIVPKHLYWDDTPDPPSGLSIEKGHVFRSSSDRLCNPPAHLLNITHEEDVERGYMYTDDDYEMLQYEDELVKEMRDCESVYEMYGLADKMIGELLSLLELGNT